MVLGTLLHIFFGHVVVLLSGRAVSARDVKSARLSSSLVGTFERGNGNRDGNVWVLSGLYGIE